MRRLFVLAAFALLGVLALPAVAGAGNDVARGHGIGAFFFEEFDFNARSNFNGTEPDGHATIQFPTFDPDIVVKGHVTCLSVIGNTATLSGDVVSASSPSFAPTAFIIRVVDVADPGAGLDQYGSVFLFGIPAPPPPTCTTFTIFTSPINNGEIDVSDALN